MLRWWPTGAASQLSAISVGQTACGVTEETDRKLAAAWIRIQRSWWAYEELATACEKHPRKAWRLLEHIASRATTDELIADLGAGPLEDFIRLHAPRFIGQIERRAASHGRFRRALSHAWLPEATDRTSARLFALGCKPIKVDRAPWQS